MATNRGVLIPAACGLLAGTALVLLEAGVTFDLRFLDAMQRSTTPAAESPVVIVDIDSDSVIDFGWPMSPAIHALVIQTVHDAGAKAIGVDVLFHDPRMRWLDENGDEGVSVQRATLEEADPEDLLLGDVVRQTGAILATSSQREMEDGPRPGVFPATPAGAVGKCETRDERALATPLRPGLRSSAVGHVHLVTVPDGVHRSLVDCVPVHDGCLRSFSSMMVEPEGADARCGAAEIVFFGRSFHDFERISMADVVASMGSPEGEAALRSLFRDKYVLVGPSDTGIGDLGPTPADRWEPLVTVHANRVEALLAGRYIGQVPAWVPLLGAIGLMLALALLPLPARAWLGVAAAGAALPFLASFGAFRLFSHWLPVTPFVLPMLLGALSCAAQLGWRHLRFNQMLTQAFGSYVSPDVLDWLQETEGAALDPTAAERREITVLFSDVAGYTRLSNDLAPEGVMRSLRLYLQAMVAVIQRHGGYLDKINGDGLMVLFGAPKILERSADSAVGCAREMLEEVERLQEDWRKITGNDLMIRVGVATGRAFVGNLGGEEHVEYTAIGPVVNLAARLESKAPIGGLLLCEDTHEALSEPPPGQWTEVELKGYEKAGPVRVFSVPPPTGERPSK